MNRLSDKVAIITGAARGMGKEEAKLFAKEGAKVVVADIIENEAIEVAKEIAENGGEAMACKLDVSNAKNWERMVEEISNKWGKIDILVNNAGILSLAGVEEATEEQWDKVMAVNAKGNFLGVKYVLPVMKKAQKGSIINISSIYGLIGSGAAAAYHASKGAVRLFTKTIAAELAKYNIRVNSIHPGVIRTAMTDELLKDPANTKNLLGTTILGRPAEAIEVAYGALFLASDESSYMTGSELVIDGGYTAL
ncbi:MAG TPA: glucose 1-dehydrogenase [Bacteroidales bacterium]|jgi:cyclopentanol dehydrogenase|nr:glucose 1-dehydrogenase [Bacteroidales bacterium]MDI9572897.1 glucose 1-dehydrogenase [Bacteroidota bacterium]OQC60893.1 MAG: Cyclopentanol dehydrogenase [Bacteroidetes bacterium ADurb.Bin012]MBP9510870.1 glucose 1-dehydrogenase [Bacteroidales bacterium]MBP9587798.1 glucose 1-dehydrogenase [Bacteroidales bacterium]